MKLVLRDMIDRDQLRVPDLIQLVGLLSDVKVPLDYRGPKYEKYRDIKVETIRQLLEAVDPAMFRYFNHFSASVER